MALVFFSWLTIAWTAALVEMIAEGLLGGISGAVVGALFGTGDAIAAFCGWIVLGIVISALINVVCPLQLALPLFMVVVASGVGSARSGGFWNWILGCDISSNSECISKSN